MTTTTIYTSEEVAKHNSKSDLWVTIHNKVYDITPYLEDHPGGIASLIEVAGVDATSEFEELGHSQHAVELLQRFLVGKLDHDEEAVQPSIVRQLPPEPAMHPKPVLGIAITKSFIELLTICAIVTIGFISVQHFDRVAVKQASWLMPTAVSNLLPWLTATSMASALINRYMQKSWPSPTPAEHRAHFKVDPAKLASKPHMKETALKPGQFVDLPITSIEKLSENSNKITLDLPSSSSVLGLPIGQHITIRGTVNGKEVLRSYTPTSSNKDLGRLEIVIKNYDDGLLTGQYLRNVQVGDLLSISGPKGQMHYRRGLAQTINMIAGGTGISPMYQLIRAICEDPQDTTKIVLIYANQTPADILLKAELDAFASKHADQLSIHYILSKPGPDWTGHVGRCTQALCQELLASGEDKSNKAMLCGPPGMVDSAKEWLVALQYDPAKTTSRMRDQVFVF